MMMKITMHGSKNEMSMTRNSSTRENDVEKVMTSNV